MKLFFGRKWSINWPKFYPKMFIICYAYECKFDSVIVLYSGRRKGEMLMPLCHPISIISLNIVGQKFISSLYADFQTLNFSLIRFRVQSHGCFDTIPTSCYEGLYPIS